MKQLLILTLAVAAFCGCATRKTAPAFPPEKPFDITVFDVVIPHIKIENLTAEEAVAVLLEKWREQLDGRSPPRVAFTDPGVIFLDERENHVRVLRDTTTSFDVENIAVDDCLRLILRGTGRFRDFVIENNLLVLPSSYNSFHEPWTVVMFDVSDKARKALGIHDGISPEELREMFESFGFVFEDWCKIQYLHNIDNLFMVIDYRDVPKIESLLFFIDAGCEIKPIPMKQ